jgi:drug/metabolite transporter (DMT)-like permease
VPGVVAAPADSTLTPDGWLAACLPAPPPPLPALPPRSAIPVVACLMAILVESKYPSRQEALSLVVLSLGVMLAVWQGTITGKPYAIAFSIAATICNGAMMTFSSKLMRCVGGRALGRAHGQEDGWRVVCAGCGIAAAAAPPAAPPCSCPGSCFVCPSPLCLLSRHA